MIRYVDTSAALKLVIDEAESQALAAELTAAGVAEEPLVSSMLLWTELHCAAQRREEVEPEQITSVLDGIDLVDLTRADLLRAGSSAWGLRSADAIHLAVALRLDCDELIAYDHELLAAARAAGLRTRAPGDLRD